MIYIKNLFSFMAVVVVLALGALLFPAVQAQAGAPCLVDIEKEAIPSDGTDFDFTCTGGDGGDCGNNAEFTLMDSDGEDISLGGQGSLATVVEDVPEGWELDDISCTAPDGITFDFNAVDNGVVINCSAVQTTLGTCTFRNIKQCSITIEKKALADNGTLFDFTAPGSSDPNFALENNDDIELLIDSGENVDVTEIVPDAWVLEAIECSVPDGVVITEIPNGRNFACSPDGTADCVFINRPIRNIPTLSEWGLIAMAGILGLVGFMVLRRRKAVA